MQPKSEPCWWYMLRGFNVNDKEDNGFLALDKDFRTHKKTIYKITHSRSEALKFPSQNINNVKGFGTPKQWLEFFKGEHELKDWKFHLMKTTAPKINKTSKD